MFFYPDDHIRNIRLSWWTFVFHGWKSIYHRSPKQHQNDMMYMADGVRKKDVAPECLLCTRPILRHSVMASVSFSAVGCTNLHIVDPGVKINGQYYYDTLLMKDLLPHIKQSSPDYFNFQQDGAPVHRACEWNSQLAMVRDTQLYSSRSVATE